MEGPSSAKPGSAPSSAVANRREVASPAAAGAPVPAAARGARDGGTEGLSTSLRRSSSSLNSMMTVMATREQRRA
jgi:hypothetical protein